MDHSHRLVSQTPVKRGEKAREKFYTGGLFSMDSTIPNANWNIGRAAGWDQLSYILYIYIHTLPSQKDWRGLGPLRFESK